MYIHELPGWPGFHWDRQRIAETLAAVRFRQGRLIGRVGGIGFPMRSEAVLTTLTSDVVKSSEIEGETLNTADVRSSVARRLGIDIGALRPADRHVDGVVEMVLDATQRCDEALTADRLLGWHASLFPTGRSGLSRIRVAAWRDDSRGPMQVISGPVGHERVHYQAPPAIRIPGELDSFLGWFNAGAEIDPVVKAAIAHLWFVTLHPFDDGNGRIARAIADLALARSENSTQRFYSMSSRIRIERDSYYEALERTQKGTLDITSWVEWFLLCLGRAIDDADVVLAPVLAKAGFWERIREVRINDRQRRVLARLLEGFEGKLTTSKYAKLAKCSQDTAFRDILALVESGVLSRSTEGGRSTSYSLMSV